MGHTACSGRGVTSNRMRDFSGKNEDEAQNGVMAPESLVKTCPHVIQSQDYKGIEGRSSPVEAQEIVQKEDKHICKNPSL
jgi:hypothetical protein